VKRGPKIAKPRSRAFLKLFPGRLRLSFTLLHPPIQSFLIQLSHYFRNRMRIALSRSVPAPLSRKVFVPLPPSSRPLAASSPLAMAAAPRVLIPVANGTEEMEATIMIDVLRRSVKTRLFETTSTPSRARSAPTPFHFTCFPLTFLCNVFLLNTT
jgi:hypothetical protein